MAAALLLVVLGPMMLAVLTIAKNEDHITAQLRSFDPFSLTWPPQWLKRIPLAGKSSHTDPLDGVCRAELGGRRSPSSPYLQRALQWFVAQAGSTA